MKKNIYLIIIVTTLFLTVSSTTYAYWVATASSQTNSINTQSTIYNINMTLLPLYNDSTFIPMNDTDALKALSHKCKDKYNRGACSAYQIHVFGYNSDLNYISGIMDITTNNMTNLSYMVYQISDTFEEDKCITIEKENYCISKEATPIGTGEKLSLGDSYNVQGIEETKFILLIWLTNLSTSQNEEDIGSFNATVTIQAGSGGEIKGSISSAIKINDEKVE